MPLPQYNLASYALMNPRSNFSANPLRCGWNDHCRPGRKEKPGPRRRPVRDRLGYGYLGNRIDRENRDIEPRLLTSWLKRPGASGTLINRSLHELNKAAKDNQRERLQYYISAD